MGNYQVGNTYYSDMLSNEPENAIVHFKPNGDILFANSEYSVYHYLSGKKTISYADSFFDYLTNDTKDTILNIIEDFDRSDICVKEYKSELKFKSFNASISVNGTLIIENCENETTIKLAIPLFRTEPHIKKSKTAILDTKYTTESVSSESYQDYFFFNAITEAFSLLVSGSDLDHVLQKSLETVSSAMKCNVVYLTQVIQEPQTGLPAMLPKYQFKQSQLIAFDRNTLPMVFADVGLNGWYNALCKNQKIVSNVKDLSTTESQLFSDIGVKSLVVCPLNIHGSLWGFIEFDYMYSERNWSEIQISLIGAYAAAVANHLLRVQDQEMLQSFTSDLFDAKIILEQQAHDLEIKNNELESARQAAETANRSKTAFLSSMSHELRTPLNAIIGFSQILQKDKYIPENSRNSVEMMYRSGVHLLEMINDVLDLSKIESGKMEFYPETIDLHALLDDIYGMFSLRCKEKDLWLSIEKPPGLLRYAVVDPKRLRQVLINFIGNSIKFTKKGGITLKVKGNVVSNDEAVFTFVVTDTGRGIPKDQLKSIFEPFQQVKGQYSEGTGLGLAICKKIVTMMGSSGIKVQSEVGIGSTFSFEVAFKISDSKIYTKSNNRETVTGVSYHTTPVVLIVDRGSINNAIIKGFLEPVGFIVKTVDGLKSAIVKIRESKVDVIIADIALFDDFSFQADTFKQELFPMEIPVIVYSANALSDSRESVKRLGFDEFLPLPFYEKQLFETIGNVINITYVKESKHEQFYSAESSAQKEIVEWLESVVPELRMRLQNAIEVQDFDTINDVLMELSEEERLNQAVLKLQEVCMQNSYKFLIQLSMMFV